MLQVREGCDVEDDAVHAVQGQGVGRQLNDASAALVLLGGRQEAGVTGASAVVRQPPRKENRGPRASPQVPHREAWGKREAMAARIRYEVVVLPFVPVTAMVVRREAGAE